MKRIILVQIIAYLYEQWNFFHIRKWEKWRMNISIDGIKSLMKVLKVRIS